LLCKVKKVKKDCSITSHCGGKVVEDQKKEAVIQEYLKRIDRMMGLLVRRLHAELAQNLVTGVTASQFVIMKKINERGRMTVSEVAGDLFVSLSAVTAQVDRLCRAGLVERHRDESDRRVVWLALTPAGKEVYEACEASRLKVIGRYLGQLEQRDLEKLLDIYTKLLKIIEADNSQ